MKYRSSVFTHHYLWITFTLLFLFTACKSSHTEEHLATSEVLIQLTENTLPEKVEKEFVAYELSNLKTVSRPMHIFLFSYNTNKIEEKDLLKLLKQSNWIKEAQSNKDLQTRN